MTNREFYEAIVNGTMNDEIVAHAQEAIEKLNHANELRKVKTAEKAAEKNLEKAPIREALVAVITDEPKTASMLVEEAGLTDTVKVASIPSLLKPFVEDGTVAKVDVKVTGKGTQRGYVRA